MNQIIVHIADSSHFHFAPLICDEIEISAKIRGTGIAKRTIEYIEDKMKQGKAIIALTEDGIWVGFCYIETWEDGKYVANSGLIVSREFRGHGIATKIKRKVFELSRSKYPKAKIFGLTTGAAVMKMNSDLGYRPVTYSELTSDESFWNGCSSCVNHPILLSKNSKNCLCTAMLYEPQLIDIVIPEHIQGESA
jgi:GNAT superfamily N-acetyltransferase